MDYIKYKTTLCRHYEELGTCSLADACSFAHGDVEKRGINDVSVTLLNPAAILNLNRSTFCFNDNQSKQHVKVLQKSKNLWWIIFICHVTINWSASYDYQT